MQRLSIIIPTLNEEACLASTLDNVQSLDPPAWEVIVVDGGSSDATVAIAMPDCEQLLIGTPGRAAQMNLGAAGLETDYLLFLHADTRVPADAEGECQVEIRGKRFPARLVKPPFARHGKACL